MALKIERGEVPIESLTATDGCGESATFNAASDGLTVSLHAEDSGFVILDREAVVALRELCTQVLSE